MATQAFITDEIVDRGIQTQRFAAHQTKEARAFLIEVYNKVIAELEAAPTNQLLLVASQIEALLLDSFTDLTEEIKSDLAKLGTIEATWAQQLLVEATILDTASRAPERVIAALNNTPMNMTTERPITIDQMFDNIANESTQQAALTFRTSVAAGKTNDEIVKELKQQIVDVPTSKIQRDVITANTHITTQAREATFAANDDIIEGMKWVSVFDKRISTICFKLGSTGEIYPIGQGEFPPKHRRCRSSRMPVIKEEFRIPIPGRERASEVGPVSAQLTPSGYAKQRGAAWQDEVLGPTRGKLFREGGLLAKEMGDSSGKTYTLAELEALYPAKWAKAFGNNN